MLPVISMQMHKEFLTKFVFNVYINTTFQASIFARLICDWLAGEVRPALDQTAQACDQT